MQFVIKAYDGTDPDVLPRRMSVRPDHLAYLSKATKDGHIICAGGLLNDEGKLKGSCLITEFDSREALDEFVKNEPYVIADVWQDITIDRINVLVSGSKEV